MKDYQKLNTVVIGCSGDSVEALAKFKAKFKLNFPLVSDPNFDAIEAYGARRMKTFLGKSFLGIVRSSLWIGPDGTVQKLWEKAPSSGHAGDVLSTLRAASTVS
jgi:peroxiredoxin Q/BCP